MDNIENIKKIVNELLHSGKFVRYQIFKATGVSQGYLSDLKNGKKSIDDLGLGTAEKLVKYYDENKKD